MGSGSKGVAPDAPHDLSEASRSRWPGLAEDLIVVSGGAETDFALLAELLRAVDRLKQVRAILDSEGLTVAGSKGQLRPHPLLVTESVLRREVAEGYRRLRLDPGSRSAYQQITPQGRIVPY